MTIIRLSGVEKTYLMGEFEVHALRGLAMEINEGDYVAIMGPSGSGKSTLMHILGCLDRPTKGSYELRGRAIESLNDDELSYTRNKEIGFVFQSFNLLPIMTVQQNVELPMVYGGIGTADRRKRAKNQIEAVGLHDRGHHLPNELSGGQRQRVAIARALVNDPAILLADEPTGNLDSKTGEEIMVLFQQLSDQGRTIIVVTHERDIAEHAHKIIHIRDGVVNNVEVVKKSGDG
ncbi:MAG: ABC transporter ATP-binding protein [Candidatus Sumerlaeota bacterium]